MIKQNMTEWTECKISDIGTVVGGATPSTKNSKNYDNGTISWITPKDLSTFDGRYISNGERNITKDGLESCSAQLLPKNTILFSSRAPIGYVAIAAKEMCTNQGFKSVIPNEKINPIFLYYLLKYNKSKIEAMGSGTTFKEVSGNTMMNVLVSIPSDKKTQVQIASILDSFDSKIELNNKINHNLEQQVAAIYDYWFTQFDFPNANGDPYCSSGGQMVWNDTLKRNIPDRWKVQSIISNCLASVIKPGVEVFDTKSYLATADIKGTTLSVGTIIDYEGRESRANMQPSINSVWFAKMKNSIKHLNLNKEMKPVISNTILSTGFCGLQCSEESFEYIASYIANPYFEIHKDMLAHGATQEAVNNDDLAGVNIIVPSDAVLHAYHEITQPIYAQISKNICENQELVKLRDWLLPMLMNGQATIGD